jgi:hypothetical protein
MVILESGAITIFTLFSPEVITTAPLVGQSAPAGVNRGILVAILYPSSKAACSYPARNRDRFAARGIRKARYRRCKLDGLQVIPWAADGLEGCLCGFSGSRSLFITSILNVISAEEFGQEMDRGVGNK